MNEDEMLSMSAYFILLKHDDDIYLQCEKNGRVMGFKTEQNAIDCWEIPYKQAFERGLQGATGAMLAHIACQPSVVYFDSQLKMLETLFDDPPFELNQFGMTCNGIKVHKDVLELWESGVKPALVEYH